MQISPTLSQTHVHDLSVGELLSLLRLFMDNYANPEYYKNKVSGVNKLSPIIGKSQATIYRYLKDGTIPENAAIKIGNTYHFDIRKVRESLQIPR